MFYLKHKACIIRHQRRGMIAIAMCVLATNMLCRVPKLSAQQNQMHPQTQQSTRRPSNSQQQNRTEPRRLDKRFPVEPAAAQFSQQHPNSAQHPDLSPGPNVQHEYIDPYQYVPDQNGSPTNARSRAQSFEGYQINRPQPRTATERALELAAENAELRDLLQQRNLENQTLRTELTQSQHAIVSANHAVASTVEKIDRISRVLADRNDQIRQMQEMIREHESITAGHLRRLMTTIRRSMESQSTYNSSDSIANQPAASNSAETRQAIPNMNRTSASANMPEQNESTSSNFLPSATNPEGSSLINELRTPANPVTPSLKFPTAQRPAGFSLNDGQGATR